MSDRGSHESQRENMTISPATDETGIVWPMSSGTIPDADPYGASIEYTGDGGCMVEYNGLEADQFVSRALANLEHGCGCVATGRVDPLRPHLPPHKIAWCHGLHGHNARTLTAAEIAAVPRRIVARIVRASGVCST